MDPLFPNLGPAQGVPITPDTHIRLTVNSALASGTFTLRVRTLDDAGHIVENQFSLKQSAANTTTRDIFKLDGRFLLDANVRFDSTGFRANSIYFSLSLQKGPAVGNPQFRTLAAGYLNDEAGSAFPGAGITPPQAGIGFHDFFNVAAPGAGNDVTITPNSNTRALVIAIKTSLTTDATAGNRTVQLSLPDINMEVPAEDTQAPSTSRTYFFARYGNIVSPVANTIYVNMPAEVYMRPGQEPLITANNLAGGDAFGVTAIEYIGWIENI